MRLISLYRPDCESSSASFCIPVQLLLIHVSIQRNYPALIVGTKGSRSTLQKFGAALGAPGMGSVSRYCVSHSPVPVIVVRWVSLSHTYPVYHPLQWRLIQIRTFLASSDSPERKVKKTLAKRQNDPKRQKYKAMVGSEALGLRRSRSAESRERGGALSD
jgi:hypothetical protein